MKYIARLILAVLVLTALVGLSQWQIVWGPDVHSSALVVFAVAIGIAGAIIGVITIFVFLIYLADL